MPSSQTLNRFFPVQHSTTDGVPFYPPERERFSNTGSTIVDLHDQGIPTPRLFGYLRYLHKTDGEPTSLHVIVRMYSRQELICYVTEDYSRLEWNKQNAGAFVPEDHPNISERETQTPLNTHYAVESHGKDNTLVRSINHSIAHRVEVTVDRQQLQKQQEIRATEELQIGQQLSTDPVAVEKRVEKLQSRLHGAKRRSPRRGAGSKRPRRNLHASKIWTWEPETRRARRPW